MQSKAPTPRPVLVIGGTGKTGRRVAERLIERGIATRIASRQAGTHFDWNDRSSWGAALAGVNAVYLTYAPDLAVPGATEAVRAFTTQAKTAGLQRIVLLSGRGEEEAQAAEAIVQQSGLEWTIVRASWFNQNFSEGEFAGMVLNGNITLPAGDTPEPFVDADDIADVAVAALTETGHKGELYEVTGPRLLTLADIAEELSQASGRSVAYTEIPHEAFTDEIAKSGAPEQVAWLLDYLFSTVLDGRNAHICDGVERALGRKPTDFSEFARRAAASGAWNLVAE